jgi:hypothetical protein
MASPTMKIRQRHPITPSHAPSLPPCRSSWRWYEDDPLPVRCSARQPGGRACPIEFRGSLNLKICKLEMSNGRVATGCMRAHHPWTNPTRLHCRRLRRASGLKRGFLFVSSDEGSASRNACAYTVDVNDQCVRTHAYPEGNELKIGPVSMCQ